MRGMRPAHRYRERALRSELHPGWPQAAFLAPTYSLFSLARPEPRGNRALGLREGGMLWEMPAMPGRHHPRGGLSYSQAGRLRNIGHCLLPSSCSYTSPAHCSTQLGTDSYTNPLSPLYHTPLTPSPPALCLFSMAASSFTLLHRAPLRPHTSTTSGS